MAETDAQPELNDKQKQFVAFYCGDARLNKARAARMAGYSEKSARRYGLDLYKTPHIRARIDEILNGEILSGPEVLHELTDVAMRGLEECIEVKEYGEDVTARMDASAKMKALELLGKHHQLFADRQIVEGEMIQRIYVGIDPDEFDSEPAE